MRLRLVDDRVALIPEPETEERSPGGIILARFKGQKDKGQIPIRRAYVLEVGPGRLTESGKREPVMFKPGDYVWYSVMLGVEIRWRDKATGKDHEVLLCSEGDCFGVEDAESSWEFPEEWKPGEQALVGKRVLA